KEGLLERAEIEILSARETRVLPDSGLIEAIVAREPDILGFSLDLGSSLRSLYIAAEVKKQLPGVKVIVGGPDVTLDSGHVTGNRVVDIGVIGEGEVTFCEIVRHALEGNGDYSDIKGIFYRRDGNLAVNEERGKIQDLNEIPSPYLLGYIDPAEFRMIYLENTRGCRHRCSYCQGAGTYSGHFPTERIIRELEYAVERGVRFVAFCDSSFISSPNFREICGYIKSKLLQHPVEFFGFAYAEDLTPEKADLLKECRFNNIEIGLQSANPSTLKAVGRGVALDRFVKGIRLLEERGIEYVIDVIIGLPDDTAEMFRKTLRFITDNNIRNLRAFRLRVLPGTRLRKDARKYGIRCRKEPPYDIIEAAYMTGDDIQGSIARAKCGYHPTFSGSFSSYCQSEYPRKHARGGGRTGEGERFNKVVIELDRGVQSGGRLRAAGEKLAGKIHQPFTVHFRSEDAGRDAGLMKSFIEPIAERNPYLVWNVILESDKEFGPQVIQRLRESIPGVEKEDLYVNDTGSISALSVCGVFPWKGYGREKRGGRERGEGFLFYRAVEVCGGESWREDACGALAEENGRGILVDFDRSLSMSTVLEAAGYLREEGKKRDKEVHFRNIALAYAGSGVAGQGDRVIESVIEIDRRMRISRALSADAKTCLELVSWQMKLGKSREKIIRPVTYDRPYR
ncbi:MAG: B12-binding domain-containing radical SAM protein, partial [Endomicrobiales bacterium]